MRVEDGAPKLAHEFFIGKKRRSIWGRLGKEGREVLTSRRRCDGFCDRADWISARLRVIYKAICMQVFFRARRPITEIKARKFAFLDGASALLPGLLICTRGDSRKYIRGDVYCW